ncbi:CENP-B protein [Viridothelium virens]|uniref:CENP-B protein n=1 Tax=Viridothelium virens TaxID=1048519 RepID=A0A6A6GRG5_VIRVR|nr:CENP-B protein [Viridothelium virens]
MLILDGHSSHIDLNFLFTCKTVLNIALVFPPPYTTHILQPLDFTAFSPVKTCYWSQISQLAAINNAAPIKKSRFIQYYYQARQEGLTTKNILSGWRSAGL